MVYVDARAGETKIEPPEYWEQSLTDRFLQHATIAAAGSVAAGTSSKREENMNDRIAVRLKGHVDFEEGRKRAELVLADRWAKHSPRASGPPHSSSAGGSKATSCCGFWRVSDWGGWSFPRPAADPVLEEGRPVA